MSSIWNSRVCHNAVNLKSTLKLETVKKAQIGKFIQLTNVPKFRPLWLAYSTLSSARHQASPWAWYWGNTPQSEILDDILKEKKTYTTLPNHLKLTLNSYF